MISPWLFSWLLAVIICVQCKGIAGDECTNYSDLQNLTSRHPDNVYDSNTTAISDNLGFETKWYRAGDLDMPNTMPETNRCGTAWPFYLIDPVPMNTEIQDNRACIGDQYDPCYYYKRIQVRNCGNYRVYKLTSIGLNDAAYCFRTCANCNLPSVTTSTSMSTVTSTSEVSTPTTTTQTPPTTTTHTPPTTPTTTTLPTTTTSTSSTTTTTTVQTTTARPTLPTRSTTSTTTTETQRLSPHSSEVCFRPMEFVLVILSCLILCSLLPLAIVIYLRKRPMFGKYEEKDTTYTEASDLSYSQNVHVYDVISVPEKPTKS